MWPSLEVDPEVTPSIFRIRSRHQGCTAGIEHRLHREKGLPGRNLPQCWLHPFQSPPQYLPQIPRTQPRLQVLRHQCQQCRPRLGPDHEEQRWSRHLPHQRSRGPLPQKQSHLHQGYRLLPRLQNNVPHK